jgi:hypothetical protein
VFPRVDQLTRDELLLFRSILADLKSSDGADVLHAELSVVPAFNAFVAAWKSCTPSLTAMGESSLDGIDQFLQTPQSWMQMALVHIPECTQPRSESAL